MSAARTPLLDRLIALVGLLLGAPFVGLGALGIKATSPGPVVYRAARAGRHGAPFTMYKLRTMHVDSDGAGRITSAGDPRVFTVGRWLRRLKLDEVPQLVNVLRGDMALVGPRPEDLQIVREHYDAMGWESLEVPPGVTSPGTLHYFAGEAALPDDPAEAERLYLGELLHRKLAYDLAFVRHRSLRYELSILGRTALGIVAPRPVMERLFATRERWEREQAAAILTEWRPA